ncbi:TetR/AcrR family transcriptional regulator [Sphingopyxis sp. KK2]|uniref:TetR/AcrR family transcriptional regulator n=1 Tax=Sphingopyxis sp. KK2 TaxID=1855727 RepID=UPI001C4E2BD8|nr:TetR/AcrR family transcriptional regulator [Sphingopyxis sp. KK2]
MAALELFDRDGTEKTSVATICQRSGVSNGSFFHAFPTKDALAADLFLAILIDYHGEIVAALTRSSDAKAGIEAIILAHLRWVTEERQKAKYLFEQAKAEWLNSIRAEQSAENERFVAIVDGWRTPFVEAGKLRAMPVSIFVAQIIGPAQIMCRAWLGGRSSNEPGRYSDMLVTCAVGGLVA